ncbi:unnamed protein product [Echinostoma caproni]|uniref:PHD-type domain-containing protein n=1 Tax=Echinostoma caproni TaxID=27848 RepID=A0A183APC1_9TREM|nr:unnamed protein product [Echinostoma caproni]
MPRLKEVTHILHDWIHQPTSKNDSKPAEVFDTHPLSEMILSSESEAGKSEHMVLIENPWKSEWHKNGVQVPVHALHELPVPSFRYEKLWHEEEDDRYNSGLHCLNKEIRRMPVYHIDDFDQAWVTTANEERECLGEALISDWMLEEVIEALEHLTFLRMQEKIKELEGEALEFDENAKCDYEGEDGNELVFCDSCFLCVHQACYGIPSLPEGSWICRRCEAGAKSTTPCSLCPNTGGAMKKANCALWVPEVGFGNVELMEPVIKLDSIPQARRSLLCCICRSRYGAPIQCYNKKCKVAFHVTCAFQSNLVMRQELLEKDVRLVGLCPKHSRKDQQHQSGRSPSKNVPRSAPLKSPNQSPVPTNCGSNQQSSIALRKQRILELENDFHKLITDPELVAHLNRRHQKVSSPKVGRTNAGSSPRKMVIPEDIRLAISAYWRLKRRANFNQPLVSPVPMEWRQTATEVVATTKEALAQAARAKEEMLAFDAFRRIRFGLDRARLVLDMVLKRERRKSALFKRMSRILEIQLRMLMTGKRCSLSAEDRSFISTVHIGDSIYDNAELFEAHRSGRVSGASSSQSLKTNNCNSQLTSVEKAQIRDQKERVVPPNASEASNSKKSSDLTPCDLSAIPREQFVVPEDIKQRLRSALAMVSTNRLSTTTPVNPRSKALIGVETISTKEGNIRIIPGIYQSSGTTRTKRSPSENIFACFGAQSSLGEFQSPTPAKRANRRSVNLSQTLPLPPFGDHTVPVLSKFATVRLGPGAVRLI